MTGTTSARNGADACTDIDPIRIVIVDDQPLWHRLLEVLLRDCNDLAFVGSALDGLQGCELVERLSPDVVVLDLNMPVHDGLTAIPRLLLVVPPCAVVVWSGERPAEVNRAIEAGASASHSKHSSPYDIPGVIRAAFSAKKMEVRPT